MKRKVRTLLCYPIPDDMLADMLTWNERCKNESDSDWLISCLPYRRERQREKGEEIGEFYRLSLCVHFDERSGEPHLHINDFYGLKAALRIDRPEYFDHEDYTGRLSEGQLRELQSYLSSPDMNKPRWWYLLRRWNELNEDSDRILPVATPLPNYLELLSGG